MRHEGVSALENFILLYRDLMSFEAERNATVNEPRLATYPSPYPICIGTVRGGEWASSVPETVRAEGRFGVAVQEDVAAARLAFETRVAACCEARLPREHPGAVECGGTFAPCDRPPMPASDGGGGAARDSRVGRELVGSPTAPIPPLVNGRTPASVGPEMSPGPPRGHPSPCATDEARGGVALSVLRSRVDDRFCLSRSWWPRVPPWSPRPSCPRFAFGCQELDDHRA